MLKWMKHIVIMALMLSILLCLAACGSSEDNPSSLPSSKQSAGMEAGFSEDEKTAPVQRFCLFDEEKGRRNSWGNQKKLLRRA